MPNRIVIADTGVANRYSIRNALEFIGCDVLVSQRAEDILEAAKLIFPGVGSFSAGMATISQRGLIKPLEEAVMKRRIPVLGICLGFQMMAEFSDEDGKHEGLGWLPGHVERITPNGGSLKIPHIGFNDVSHVSHSALFRGMPQHSDFYFLHSYRMRIADKFVSGTCQYGDTIVAAVESGNIMGTQFHPEKSQSAGLQLLRNFIDWNPGSC